MCHILFCCSIYIYIYILKDYFLSLAAPVCIYLGRKSGNVKGECFQADIDKDRISHLQEGIKAKVC